MPHFSIRIDFDDEGRLGPGKVSLLERMFAAYLIFVSLRFILSLMQV